MRNSLVIVKFGMVVLGVAVFFTYVLPTLRKVSEVQDNIALYQRETEKVAAVNSQLSSLSSQIDSISLQRHEDLFAYLPDRVNHVAVLRDLRNMADQAGVALEDISYTDSSDESNGSSNNFTGEAASATPGLVAHPFEISGVGSYGSIKDLLTRMEHNKYQLDIAEMNLEAEEGGLIGFSITANVYQRVDVIQDTSVEEDIY